MSRANKNKELITLQWHYNGHVGVSITSLTIAYSTVYPDADQRKYESTASHAFVRGIHRWPVNSSNKWPVTRRRFPFDDVIMVRSIRIIRSFLRKLHFYNAYTALASLIHCINLQVNYDNLANELLWRYVIYSVIVWFAKLPHGFKIITYNWLFSSQPETSRLGIRLLSHFKVFHESMSLLPIWTSLTNI